MGIDTQSSNGGQKIDNFLSYSTLAPIFLDLEEGFSSHTNIFQMLEDGNIGYRFHTSGGQIFKTDIKAGGEEFIGKNMYKVAEFELDNIDFVYEVIQKIHKINLHLYFIVEDGKIYLFLEKRSSDNSINSTTEEAREGVNSVIN